LPVSVGQDLHVSSQTRNKVKGGLRLHVVVIELLSHENKELLIPVNTGEREKG
jgi:hypothetical protein